MRIDSTNEAINHLVNEIDELIQIRDQQYKSLYKFLEQIKQYSKVSYQEILTLQRLFQSFNETYDTIEKQLAYLEGRLIEKKDTVSILAQVTTIKTKLATQENQLQQLSLRISDRFR